MRSRGPFHRAARAVARRALRRAAKHWSSTTAEPNLLQWRLQRDPDGHLALDGVRLAQLARRYGAPVHVVDAVRLRENAARFTNCPAALKPCEVYYSYKANPVPGVLRLLHASGCGAETSSPFELWLARTLKVPPERVIYNGPMKPEAALTDAVACGVGLINVSSRHDLSTLAAVARGLGRRVRIGIRVALPHAVAGQFGERIADGSALQTFVEALERPELEVVCVHGHLNGEIATRDDLHALVNPVLRFCSSLRARLGYEPKLLDFGGNLQVPTVARKSAALARVEMALAQEALKEREELKLTIDQYVTDLVNTVEMHYRGVGRPAPKVLVEPGRAMTSNAQLLLLNVVQIRNPDDTGISTVVLDGGINVADPLRAERHEVLSTHVRPGAERFRYRVAGPTCSLSDLLYPCVDLPRLEVGDTLAVMDSGAYFIPFSSTFSFPRPGVVMLDRGEETLLRRPETFEDLVALDQFEAG